MNTMLRTAVATTALVTFFAIFALRAQEPDNRKEEAKPVILNLTIDGIESDQGQILVFVCNEEIRDNQAFSKNSMTNTSMAVVKPREGSVTVKLGLIDPDQEEIYYTQNENGNYIVTMGRLQPGKNFIYAIHDLNNDRKLDLDEDGRPAEPCCDGEAILAEGENYLTIKLINR